MAWLLPIYEFSHARDIHSYTRHRDLLRRLLARATKYKGSFRFSASGAKIWNTLPLLALRSTHDLNKFRFGLKRYF